jgi:hypothetical protein
VALGRNTRASTFDPIHYKTTSSARVKAATDSGLSNVVTRELQPLPETINANSTSDVASNRRYAVCTTQGVSPFRAQPITMPTAPRTIVTPASSASAGNAALTGSAVGALLNNCTRTRRVDSNPNVDLTPATSVTTSTKRVRVGSACQLIPIASRISPVVQQRPRARRSAAARSRMPTSQSAARSSGNTDIRLIQRRPHGYTDLDNLIEMIHLGHG